jgi:rhodanese-related sulfurtransferase
VAVTTLVEIPVDSALELIDRGAAVVDLRPIDDFLDVHVPGSLPLLYEAGPGMAARARDCLPLSLPLLLAHRADVDMASAAAAFRGKGFSVLGVVADIVNGWAEARGAPASTEVVTGSGAPRGTVLDVGDPGAPRVEGAVRVPVEKLWGRTHEVDAGEPVVVVSGFGVRAGLAVGILERAGREPVVWRPRAVRNLS